MKRIFILNGPNLNLLGKREPEIYGRQSFEGFLTELKLQYEGRAEIQYFQSNHEGAMLDVIHQHATAIDGMIINAGAYSHTSVALADAIRFVPVPVIEVHLSNVYARESFRQRSHIAREADGVIVGMGLRGYELALLHLLG